MRNKLSGQLLMRFGQMSGDETVRIAMRLSDAVRRVREAGAEAMDTRKHSWIKCNEIS